MPEANMMFTVRQRVLAGVGLLVAVIGQLNAWSWKVGIAGLAPDRVAILAYIPAAVVVFAVLRAKAR
jgi:hypothetical protein